MRRVVTAIDADGRSRVVSDGEAPKQIAISAGTMTELWYTPPGVGLLPLDDDPTMTADSSPMSFPVPAGFAWRVCEFRPGSAAMGMHHTPTLDFNLILDGAITLVLPEEEVHLEKGDSVILGAIDHGWRPDPERGATMVIACVGIVRPETP
jgi:hypothetical protein